MLVTRHARIWDVRRCVRRCPNCRNRQAACGLHGTANSRLACRSSRLWPVKACWKLGSRRQSWSTSGGSETDLVRKRGARAGTCWWKVPRLLELANLDGLAEEGSLVSEEAGNRIVRHDRRCLQGIQSGLCGPNTSDQVVVLHPLLEGRLHGRSWWAQRQLCRHLGSRMPATAT